MEGCGAKGKIAQQTSTGYKLPLLHFEMIKDYAQLIIEGVIHR